MNSRVDDIDPQFCRAYGAQYNPEYSKEVTVTNERAEELDHEFVLYLDNRPSTPQAEKAARRQIGEEDSDSDDEEYLRQKLRMQKGKKAKLKEKQPD